MKTHQVLTLATIAITSCTLNASIIVYESFDYADTTINPDADAGLNGGQGLAAPTGTGLRGNWIGTVTTGSLSYSGITSNGNSLMISPGENRNPGALWSYRFQASDPFSSIRSTNNASGFAATGETIFGSVMVDMSGVASGDRFWLRLPGFEQGTYNQIVISTTNGSDWGVSHQSGTSASAPGQSLITNSSVSANTNTTLLVWSHSFGTNGGSSDSFSLWINPDLANMGTANYELTTDGIVGWAGIGYRTGNNTATLDELIVATSMSDITNSVTPVPEPSTYALIAGALGLGLVFYRRKRAK